jgi:hypothetical protein
MRHVLGRALHPQLVRRSRSEDTFSVDTISAEEMVAATAAGTGRTRDPGDRRIEISVDHVYDAIATVTVTSAVYVDYLHLVATPEGLEDRERAVGPDRPGVNR